MTIRWYDNWDESFDLSGGGEELSFRRGDINTLLVETDAVRRIRQLVSKISQRGISSRYYIIGDKGYGKSTLLNYVASSLLTSLDINRKALKPIAVLCPMSGGAPDEQSLEFVFFNSLLKSIFELPPDVARLKLSTLGSPEFGRIRTADKEYREALTKFGKVSLEFVYTALENQLRHLSEGFQPIVFLLDGLDKFEPGLVLQFLRKSQERLSSFVSRYACLFVFAADPKWAETLESHEFTGVKGSPIRLRGWAFDEVWLLIQKRLEALGIFIPPFSKDAVEQLVSDFQGNPRKIMQYATLLLHYGAKQHMESIGPGIARQVVWTEEQKETLHNRIIQDPQFRYAYEKLRSLGSGGLLEILIACHTKGALRRTINYDERASLGIRLKDDDYARGIQGLMDSGSLKFGATEDFVQLENDIRAFFDFVKNAKASLEALPIVLEDYEPRIASVPLPPKEEIFIGNEVKAVFQGHSREWLDAKSVASLMLKDPRKSQALHERFGKNAEERLARTVPLMMGQFRSDGLLVYDQTSKTMRWRGLLTDKELGELVLSREVLEAFEEVKSAAGRGSPQQVAFCCKTAIDVAIDTILKSLLQNPSNCNLERRLLVLDRLGLDLKNPISLESYMAILSQNSPLSEDSIGMLVETCSLYLKRISARTSAIQRDGPGNYLRIIADPPYNARVDVVGQRLANMLNKSLCVSVGPEWIGQMVDSQVVERAKYRSGRKVPEDPRTELHEFFTIGEVRDIMKGDRIWPRLKETFVNVPNKASDASRFNSDDLFFGSLQLLLDYRNPPSHAAVLKIEPANQAMLESALTKLEKILEVTR